MNGKVIISAVSLILVVGVAIGVVCAVHKNGEDPEVKTQQRSLQVMCQNADDQKLCHETLSSVRGADAADPKAYIAAAVKAATDNVIKAFNMSDRLTTEYGKEDGTKMALNDCKDLMQFALDSLDLSTKCVHDSNIQAVHDQTADMRNWLSAVISYRQACMEGFDDENDGEKKIKEQLDVQSLDSVQKVTAVALDIVTGLSDILQQFNLKFDIKPASRRLLNSDVTVDDQDTLHGSLLLIAAFG
uniref:Pectinesterase inhibitor domain-containing protein n=1 Tax=Medicago truncatula TaxID=3880 RepID=B7FLZ0_MEDTR|nr:unknown [Medicago truncatula]